MKDLQRGGAALLQMQGAKLSSGRCEKESRWKLAEESSVLEEPRRVRVSCKSGCGETVSSKLRRELSSEAAAEESQGRRCRVGGAPAVPRTKATETLRRRQWENRAGKVSARLLSPIQWSSQKKVYACFPFFFSCIASLFVRALIGIRTYCYILSPFGRASLLLVYIHTGTFCARLGGLLMEGSLCIARATELVFVAPACTAKNGCSSSTTVAEAASLPRPFGGAPAPRLMWRGQEPEPKLHQTGQERNNFRKKNTCM